MVGKCQAHATDARDLARALVDETRARGESADLESLCAALEALEAAKRSMDGAQLAVIAEIARREQQRGRDGYLFEVRHSQPAVAEFAADAIAIAIDAGPNESWFRCEDAVGATRIPEVLDALVEGEIRDKLLHLVVRETAGATDRACAAIVDHLLQPVRGRPGTTRLTALEPREVAKACRRVLARVDEGVLERRAARNRATLLDVTLEPGPIGTSYLTAILPSEIGQVIKAAVDDLAGQIRTDQPGTPVGSARAQALTDLALRGVTVDTSVMIGIPVIPCAGSDSPFGVSTDQGPGPGFAPDSEIGCDAIGRDLRGRFDSMSSTRRACRDDQHPERPALTTPSTPPAATWVSGVEVAGVGYIPADVVASIATHMDTRVARVLLDTTTGATVETSANTYRPPAAIRRLVAARDATCRMPGCTRPATGCDIDHAVPWPQGQTAATNLASLCRHHHRVKQSPGWRHHLGADGTVTWTSPGGTSRVCLPSSHLAPADQDPTDAAHPNGSPPPKGAKAPTWCQPAPF